MTFQFFVAIAAICWLASLAACAVAMFTKRFVASLILCLIAFAIGYLGLTHIHLSASKTENGQVLWSFNSKWFFIATLVLAALTLVCTIWKHRRTNNAASPA